MPPVRVIGFGVLVAFTIALTMWVGVTHAPLPGDVWLANRVQSVNGLETFATAVNWAGDLRWIPAITFFAWWVWRERGARRWRVVGLGFLLLVLQGGSHVLKEVVDSPRPDASYGLNIDRLRDSPGFPSGHVYGDVLTYGALAFWARPVLGSRGGFLVALLAVAVVVPAGWARVYVGAHWPSDILGGYLWGTLALAILYGASHRNLGSRLGLPDVSMTADIPRAIDESIDSAGDHSVSTGPTAEENEG